MRLKENNKYIEALFMMFLFVPAAYDNKSGPQLAKHGPIPKERPIKKKLNNVLFTLPGQFLFEYFGCKYINFCCFVFPGVRGKACLLRAQRG